MCSLGFLNATDMAEWFVNELSMSFRDSHKLTGRIVKFAESKGLTLENLSLKDLKKFNSKINRNIFEKINLLNSIHNKKSSGSTEPSIVERELCLAREKWLK